MMAVESATRGMVLSNDAGLANRALPLLQHNHSPSPRSPGSPMDVVPRSEPAMPTPSRTSPDNDSAQSPDQEDGEADHSSAPDAAAAAQVGGGQQPKVVQTAFIHKLYSMLEDTKITHLISWSPSSDSFIMSPSPEFSKVLSSYFKHTNISSFVRQLNMYGFHKVSDVFHNGSTESALWEFRHGGGSFKRGDVAGLREIKRRPSRHALVHRETYPAAKPPPFPPLGLPAESLAAPQETAETRLATVEHNMFDMHSRLLAREEQMQHLQSRNNLLTDVLNRTIYLNNELSRSLLAVVPPENPAHRAVLDIHSQFTRIQDMLRSPEETQEQPYPRGQFPLPPHTDHGSVSPRQLAADDGRRPPALMGVQMRQPQFRPPSHLTLQPQRRYGSIGGNGTATSSPSSLRYQVPPPPQPPQHPLATAHSPPLPAHLARRHTTADIRQDPDWRNTTSVFVNGGPAWPPSPDRRGSIINEDPRENREAQRIRESFSQYSLADASRNREPNHTSHSPSQPASPPYSNGNNTSVESSGQNLFSWGNSRSDKFGGAQGFGPSSTLLKDGSGPPTRRGSMAHILNHPQEGVEEDEETREDDRNKRKRMM